MLVDGRTISNAIDGCQYLLIEPVTATAPDCPPLLQEAISANDADRLATALKVLADPGRLRLLSVIHAQDGGEACVCHLTGPVGLSQPTVSHHLKVLHDAGLVAREQRGSWVYYRVVPEALEGLRDLLG